MALATVFENRALRDMHVKNLIGIRYLARLAATVMMAVWWGGLTFYGLVVVPTAANVLGGETAQGFVTQEVSRSINGLAVVALVALLGGMAAEWSAATRRTKIALVGSWIVMAFVQMLLFVLHPWLDSMLDPQAHEVLDPERFHAVHEFYLTMTGIQWCAGLLHIVISLLDSPDYVRQEPLNSPSMA